MEEEKGKEETTFFTHVKNARFFFSVFRCTKVKRRRRRRESEVERYAGKGSRREGGREKKRVHSFPPPTSLFNHLASLRLRLLFSSGQVWMDRVSGGGRKEGRKEPHSDEWAEEKKEEVRRRKKRG